MTTDGRIMSWSSCSSRVAVVRVAAGEAVEAGGDQLARVDPDGVLPAALVLVDSTRAAAGRGGLGVGGAVEAAGFVAVPADELERDQVDVEGMGVGGQVDVLPHLGGAEGSGSRTATGRG
jgi:hypothetical protein